MHSDYISVPCERGTFTDGNLCTLCPSTQYQDDYDRPDCKQCPPGQLPSPGLTKCLGKILSDVKSFSAIYFLLLLPRV